MSEVPLYKFSGALDAHLQNSSLSVRLSDVLECGLGCRRAVKAGQKRVKRLEFNGRCEYRPEPQAISVAGLPILVHGIVQKRVNVQQDGDDGDPSPA